jgi:hypothetical protein
VSLVGARVARNERHLALATNRIADSKAVSRLRVNSTPACSTNSHHCRLTEKMEIVDRSCTDAAFIPFLRCQLTREIICGVKLITSVQAVLAEYPTCYACEAPRTSREHAPPRCFFPEDKDEKGDSIYRKSLIAVPSCNAHNTEKSGDDIYAAWHVAGASGTNACAKSVASTILQRSSKRDWEERDGRLMKRILREAKEFMESGVVMHVDGPRMVRFMQQCARAVYFFATLNKLKVPLRVTNLTNDPRNPAKRGEQKEREEFFDGEMRGAPSYGENAEVFTYSIREGHGDDVVLIRLLFYGSQKFWVYYHPDVRGQPYAR